MVGLDKWNSHVCPGRVFSNLNDLVERATRVGIVRWLSLTKKKKKKKKKKRKKI